MEKQHRLPYLVRLPWNLVANPVRKRVRQPLLVRRITKDLPRFKRRLACRLLGRMYRNHGLREPYYSTLERLLDEIHRDPKHERVALFLIAPGTGSESEEAVFINWWPPRPETSPPL